VKWVSTSGEFAFLSFGGSAKGIIAVGGMAHGVVAIGGFLSIGVISIGMNAIGSVAAFGMNAAAPISIALINGVGVYALAGVNGWGAWSQAKTNSTGISSQGGINSDHSFVPAVLIVIALIVASSVARGARTPRGGATAARLNQFSRATGTAVREVIARLVAVRNGSIELEADGERLTAEIHESAQRSAQALWDGSRSGPPRVLAHLARTIETVQVSAETDYRTRPAETERTVIHCADIQRAPPQASWLPQDEMEVQWVIAWTARIAAAVTILIMLAWVFSG
jgi:hypothetical protein